MPQDMAEVLRKAIRKSGHSALHISEKTGVSQPTITEFLKGADIRLKTANRLADFLGLRLRPLRSTRR